MTIFNGTANPGISNQAISSTLQRESDEFERYPTGRDVSSVGHNLTLSQLLKKIPWQDILPTPEIFKKHVFKALDEFANEFQLKTSIVSIVGGLIFLVGVFGMVYKFIFAFVLGEHHSEHVKWSTNAIFWFGSFVIAFIGGGYYGIKMHLRKQELMEEKKNTKAELFEELRTPFIANKISEIVFFRISEINEELKSLKSNTANRVQKYNELISEAMYLYASIQLPLNMPPYYGNVDDQYIPSFVDEVIDHFKQNLADSKFCHVVNQIKSALQKMILYYATIAELNSSSIKFKSDAELLVETNMHVQFILVCAIGEISNVPQTVSSSPYLIDAKILEHTQDETVRQAIRCYWKSPDNVNPFPKPYEIDYIDLARKILWLIVARYPGLLTLSYHNIHHRHLPRPEATDLNHLSLRPPPLLATPHVESCNPHQYPNASVTAAQRVVMSAMYDTGQNYNNPPSSIIGQWRAVPKK